MEENSFWQNIAINENYKKISNNVLSNQLFATEYEKLKVLFSKI